MCLDFGPSVRTMRVASEFLFFSYNHHHFFLKGVFIYLFILYGCQISCCNVDLFIEENLGWLNKNLLIINMFNLCAPNITQALKVFVVLSN